MSTTVQGSTTAGGTAGRWYALSAEDVAERLGADPVGGLSAATAADRLQQNGPNALPAE
jgi:Ca2+-transporting ATPase